MASKKGINLPRLRAILERQNQTRWGKEYIPSILATPQEAPSISRASILDSLKLNREVHVLSLPERGAALLALYHPDLIELHEQKMLSPSPRPHPLFGFPGDMDSILLPPLKGMINVADRLGYLSHLPKLKNDDLKDFINQKVIIYPYIGDLLLIMKGQFGRKFCINWNIKNTEERFRKPIIGLRKATKSDKENLLLIARHEMEEAYYRDAGIRTIRLSGDELDQHVVANLAQLFGYHKVQLVLNEDKINRILNKYQIALETRVSLLDIILELITKEGFSDHECRTILYQAIWHRRLKVDLFHPILIDRPLNPEVKDVLEVYSNWFEER